MGRYVILFICIFARLALGAQPGFSSFVHYTTDQGLSNDYIQDIVKDPKGFLWIATVNGLNRFDGHSFLSFFQDRQNPEGLPDNFIKDITLGPDGNLWVSGNKGISRIDPVSLEFRRFYLPENNDGRENDGVGKVVFDDAGNGWVSSENNLYNFNIRTGELLSYPMDRTHAGYLTTYIDKSSRIWLVNEGQITYFEPKSCHLRSFEMGDPGNPATGTAPLSIAEDQAGKLWVTTWFKGLMWYDPVRDSLIDLPDHSPITTAILPDISESGEPFFWLGGGVHGVFNFFPESGESIQFSPDPRDRYTHNNYMTSSFLKDPSDGSVWIGTEAGLEHYAPAAVRFGRVVLPVDNKFGQFSLMSGAILDNTDPSGDNYYIAMWGSGLFKWNKKLNTFVHFHKDNSGLKDNGVLSSLQDKSGNIWLGTSGVSRFNPKTGQWRSWECFSPRFNSSLNVLSCLEDRDGELWFGTQRGGLFHYNRQTDEMEEIMLPAEAYNQENKLRIPNMSLDQQGRIWLANYTQPIRFDPRSRQASFFNLDGLPGEYRQWSDVLVANNGLLYATSRDCLFEMDTSCRVLRKFNLENGLRSNQVHSLEEDLHGNIWCNTGYLLHCFNPVTGQFTYYGTTDGLFKNTISDGLNMTPDGLIFIGFQNAFNFFNPAGLIRNKVPPPLAITGIKVMDQDRKITVEQGSRIKRWFSNLLHKPGDTLLVIYPGENILTIEFAALNYNQPERNQYAYQLEGFNTEWMYTPHHFATYTNLEGGEYLFRVKGANNDGLWNETAEQLRIKVIPKLTRRWYFQISMWLLVLVIMAAIWSYRRRQRHRLEAFRESLARDLHDEMGSTLSSIHFISEFASQQLGEEKPEITPLLHRISNSAGDLSESMQDIVWAMKRKNDQLEDLTARMTEFGLRLLEARNISFKPHIEEQFSGRSLSPAVRRNLYFIFKEAVNNAAKYADATEVALSFTLQKGILTMTIVDNGKGFDVSELPGTRRGNGLHNIRKRAAEINGKLRISSAERSGTTIEIKVKI